MIQDYIKDTIILSDGGFGTYYSEITGLPSARAELANLSDFDTVLKIHKEYIESGAKLLRTNTFSCNSKSLDVSLTKVKEIITASCKVAKKAVNNRDVFIAGNIGPIPEVSDDGIEYNRVEILEEYKIIIKTFIDNNITIFNFETFSSIDYLSEIILYIRELVKNPFILVQFAITKSGISRKGFTLDFLLNSVKKLNVDVLGLNCAAGPAHLLSNIKKLNNKFDNLSVYPNAGYPEIINQRTIFNNNPNYFAETIYDSINYGVKVIGGCCGSTPKHISSLNSLIKGKITSSEHLATKETPKNIIKNNLINKDLIIAVELDPPFKPDLTKILLGAREMKDCGANFITLADSPSGRMRLNPITVAARIKRDVNIDVMPHMCCRDRNLLGLKSDILAAYTEGIRDILIITGDPIPLEERDEVKKVFNCNSVTLMNQVSNLNKSLIEDSPITIGGALNLNSVNIDSQIEKMKKKIEAGASIFLTQPIYDDRAISRLLKIKQDFNTKILAGILPLVNYKNAQFLNNEFPGITIPDNVISMFSTSMSREEAEDVGINIATVTVNKLKNFVDGFYFMVPFNRTGLIREIISKTGIK